MSPGGGVFYVLEVPSVAVSPLTTMYQGQYDVESGIESVRAWECWWVVVDLRRSLHRPDLVQRCESAGKLASCIQTFPEYS